MPSLSSRQRRTLLAAFALVLPLLGGAENARGIPTAQGPPTAANEQAGKAQSGQ